MGTLLLLLIVLAVVDSTSIGTLVIPLWFLLAAGKIQTSKFLLYLSAVAAFYFMVGLLGLFGFVSALQALGDIFTSRFFLYAEIAAGIVLFILAFRLDPKRRGTSAKESRIQRWQRMVFSGNLSNSAIVGLALTAGALELATMAPYIAAIALLAAGDVAWIERILLLGGYVIVMVLPALVLLVVRRLIHRKIHPYLVRFNAWMIKNVDDVFSWTVGIIGSALACDGTVRLIINLTTS